MPQAPKVFSLPVPGSESEGSTPTYRHPEFVSALKQGMDDPSLKTIWDCFASAVRKWPNLNCHGTRTKAPNGKAGPFSWQTYAEVNERVKHFGSGISEYMKPDTTGKMNLLGLMGTNSSEWSIAEMAALSISGTTIPLYTTTPKETLEYLLNQNGCATVVADKNCANALIKAKPAIATFTTLIVYGKDLEETKKAAEAAGLKFIPFADIEKAGKENPKELPPPTGSTVYSFIFTSGSTGMPKGALLTHESQISVIGGAFYNLDKCGINLTPGANEIHLSYLPSAHIMERAIQVNLYAIGGAIGYFQGIREELMDDLKTLRPTVFPSVPRLLNLIHDKIMNGVRTAGGIKQKLFMKALNTKVANLKKNGKLSHPLWDALVFKKIKKRLGLDRCKFIVTGSAPISGPVLDFYRAVFGIPVIEGYGATETCASASTTHPFHFSSEHVGGPSPNAELKLVSIPEMNYLATDTTHGTLTVRGRGEICVRGACIMREYYRNPEATAKAIDKDGWYHTGDVGTVLPNGTFKIFDRVGNVFKLSIGEYVAPEKIENICTRSNYVASIFVHGDALHPKLVGIVVPDPDVAAAWAKEKGLSTDIKELCKNGAFKTEILNDIDKICKKNGAASFEVPKDIYLDPEPFTIDTVLTPTLKMVRKRAMAYYDTQLKEMLGTPS